MRREKAPKDPMGGHVRIYWTMMDSPAWRTLTHADVRVYLSLRRKLVQTNNGNINATLTELKHAGMGSSSTLSAALQRLEALGFIAKTRQGGIAFGGKLCSLYRFTDVATFDIAKVGVKAGPASNEWRNFKNLADAKAVVENIKPDKKNKLRLSNRTDSTIDAERQIADAAIEQVASSAVRPSKQATSPQNVLQPA